MSKEVPIPSQFPTLTSTLGFGFCRGETHGPQVQFNSPMLPDLQRYRNCAQSAAPTARDPEGFPGGQQCREKFLPSYTQNSRHGPTNLCRSSRSLFPAGRCRLPAIFSVAEWKALRFAGAWKSTRSRQQAHPWIGFRLQRRAHRD